MALAKVTITWWLAPGDTEPTPHVGGDMASFGWVAISQETVMIERPEVDPDGCRIKSLMQRREAAAKESAKKLADIDRQIEEARRG